MGIIREVQLLLLFEHIAPQPLDSFELYETISYLTIYSRCESLAVPDCCSCTSLHKCKRQTDRHRERESNFEIIFCIFKHITEKSAPNEVSEFQSRLNQLNYTKQEFSDRQEESQTETPIKFASPSQ